MEEQEEILLNLVNDDYDEENEESDAYLVQGISNWS